MGDQSRWDYCLGKVMFHSRIESFCTGWTLISCPVILDAFDYRRDIDEFLTDVFFSDLDHLRSAFRTDLFFRGKFNKDFLHREILELIPVSLLLFAGVFPDYCILFFQDRIIVDMVFCLIEHLAVYLFQCDLPFNGFLLLLTGGTVQLFCQIVNLLLLFISQSLCLFQLFAEKLDHFCLSGYRIIQLDDKIFQFPKLKFQWIRSHAIPSFLLVLLYHISKDKTTKYGLNKGYFKVFGFSFLQIFSQ